MYFYRMPALLAAARAQPPAIFARLAWQEE